MNVEYIALSQNIFIDRVRVFCDSPFSNEPPQDRVVIMAPKSKVTKQLVERLYPDPLPIVLSSRRVVKAERLNQDTIHYTIEGTTPPELIEAVNKSRHRLDLNARLNGYLKSCAVAVWPHIGKRPAHVSKQDWGNVERRLKLTRKLPENAPPETHDLLRALHHIQSIVDLLAKENDWSDRMDKVVCLAIDLGKLLQRAQVQSDFGEKVAQASRVAEHRKRGATSVKKTAAERSENARIEFERLQSLESDQKRSTTKTLWNMSLMRTSDGSPMYGSLSTLKRYHRNWYKLTPKG